jgi:hypothetical protein
MSSLTSFEGFRALLLRKIELECGGGQTLARKFDPSTTVPVRWMTHYSR